MVYVAYSAGRLLARGDVSTTVDHGLAILRLEKTLHLDAEHTLNRLFTDSAWLGVPADFAYASLHYLITPAILVWLFRRRPAHYRAARTWLLAATLLGLVGFILVPTCPPRLLDTAHGFVDTMARYSSYGWWGTEASAPRGLGGMTNQYAAMPSLHAGWSLWCGVMLWRHGRSPLIRAAGVAYPVVITLVVLGTANHYVLDAVAGAAVLWLGLLLGKPATRLADRVNSRVSRALYTSRPPVVSAGCETSAGERIPHQRGTGGSGPADGPDGTDSAAGDSAAPAAR